MISRIKRDDLVEVIRGRDKGKRGTVQQISSKDSLAFIAVSYTHLTLPTTPYV